MTNCATRKRPRADLLESFFLAKLPETAQQPSDCDGRLDYLLDSSLRATRPARPDASLSAVLT
jgi:hypothetical protein